MAPPTRPSPALNTRENEKHIKPNLPSIPDVKKTVGPNEARAQQDLHESVSRLNIDGPPASKTLNEQAKSNIKRAGLRLDDEQTHLSSSSTKAPSLDGKSTTSVTTFAMDEKESLRPDDSASAKAAEDEDSVSGPASGAPNSRVGSESGGRAFRDQFVAVEVTENMGSGFHRPHPLSRKIIEGIQEETLPSSQTSMGPVNHTQASSARPDTAAPVPPPIELFYRDPDEKLFQALESPKDRLFLLRLEEEIINFIKSSSEPKIELPPCNSFCRLLAHKLADYYALTHFVDNAANSVTLYRTPYCRTPTPLSELAKSRSTNVVPEPPSAPPAMKIMRRPGNNRDGINADSGAGTTESSAIPSKAASEAGEDSQQGTGVASPTESTAAKDKSALTREEREARYKEKREELFGPQTDEGDNAELAKEISRTSSRSEKKKRKPRKDDDGFEARSQFNAYYPALPFLVNPFDQSNNPQAFVMQYGLQPNGFPHQSNMMAMALTQPGFQAVYQPVPNPQGYATGMSPISTMNGYGNQQQSYPVQPHAFNQPIPTQFNPHLQPVGSFGQQPAPMPSPSMSPGAQLSRPQSQMSDSHWAQNNYGPSLQNNQPGQPYYSSTGTSMPYAYGQLPFQASSPGGKLAHPVPGSYSRPTFNPQTRAFVPSGNSGLLQPQPYVNNNLSKSPGMQSAPMDFANGSTYIPYPPSSPYAPMQVASPSHEQVTKSAARTNRKASSQTQSSTHSSNSPVPQSSLSKWGTPANLPPKPPPPENTSVPEGQRTLPMNNQFGVNVQPVNSGQPMPSFQNGVYSMPGVGGP